MFSITEQRFRIAVSDADLDDLRRRLDRVRFPRVVDEADETHGIPVALMRRFVDHWRDGYEWRAHEAELNRLDHRMTQVYGLAVHYVVARAEPATGVPIVLLHGWPDSFYRYHRLVPLLVAAGHDVVVPSLPGFPLSEQPAQQLSVAAIAELVHRLVTRLGHDGYAAHGGDWGSAVAEELATAHPDAVVALHLSDVPTTTSSGSTARRRRTPRPRSWTPPGSGPSEPPTSARRRMTRRRSATA